MRKKREKRKKKEKREKVKRKIPLCPESRDSSIRRDEREDCFSHGNYFCPQLSVMDKKLDQLVYVLNAVAQKQQIPLRSIEDDV